MSRMSLFNSPFMLGFEELEESIDRLAKSSTDGYPPYNIERIDEDRLRITLAVAGFAEADLSVQVEGRQLVVRGRQGDSPERVYIHRGIAARQFQRTFMLAEGIVVEGAELERGLLHVDLVRPMSADRVETIAIRAGGNESGKTPRADGRTRRVAAQEDE